MHESAATRSIGGPPVLAWTLIGFALYLLVGAGSLFVTAILVDPILGALGMPAEAGLVGLSVRNALHPIVWGVLVAAAAVAVGRRLIPGMRFGRSSWLVLAAGLGLAAVTWFLIEEFVRARFLYVDTEYVGFSLFAWPALVALALSCWAGLALSREQRTPLVAIVLLGLIGLAAALLPSVAGAADGIAPANIPLALAFLADAAYGVAVVVLIRSA